jgi:hypothetical protein
MTSWKEFAQQAPDFAAFGAERLNGKVSYLGTVRPDGGPRVHPVTPIIGDQLFLFMEPTSPKGKDLQRDPRYTIHCAMSDASGSSAALVTDPAVREQAVAASSYKPADRYVAFVFSVEFAFMNTYDDDGTHPRRWQAAE